MRVFLASLGSICVGSACVSIAAVMQPHDRAVADAFGYTGLFGFLIGAIGILVLMASIIWESRK